MTTMVTERAAQSGAQPADRPAATMRAAAIFRLLPGRTVAYAWLLAGAPIAVLQLDHAGLHESNELPPLLHWFRDTALAAPAAAAAVVAAALVVARVRASEAGERASLVGVAAWGVLAAALFAALSVPLVQVHGALFGAEVLIGESPLEHALGEGFTTFQLALVVLVPLALLAGVPWRGAWRTTRPEPDPAFGPAGERSGRPSMPRPPIGQTHDGGDR
jgi:hypothetical protein